MKAKSVALIVAIPLLTAFAVSAAANSNDKQSRIVRLAELEIDPAQLDQYKVALKEEISASLRLEPGVLTLYAVSVRDHPEQVRLFEVYANQSAYESHLKSPHFKKYKADTQGMVRSLKLLETDPILLGDNSK